MSEEKRKRKERHYPSVYEKAVPIALTILTIIVIAMLIVIVAVVLGFFPIAS